MAHVQRCLGGCNRNVLVYCGCGGGCVSFPEDTGYCSHCYPTSPAYLEHSKTLRELVESAPEQLHALIRKYTEDFESDHQQLYIETIDDLMKQRCTKAEDESNCDSQLSLFD